LFIWIRHYWFLSALLLVLACGFWWPWLLRPLAELPLLPEALVASVLFITALPHDFSAVRRTMTQPGPSLLAITINSLLIPLAAWPISWWLPPPFRLGLFVAASVPSTLASAAVWTRRAGGNDLIPIVVTAITNLCCFVVSPFWIWLFTDRQTVELDPTSMMVRLFALVLVPILAAQLVRQSRMIADWSSQRRRFLGAISQLGILTMVGIGVVETGDQLAPQLTDGLDLLSWLQMGGSVLALHLLAFWVGWYAGAGLGFSRPDRIAIGFAGSQKTLMVGLHLALSIGGGLVLMPIITYHVLQLVADTLIVDWISSREETPIAL
jgi:sodium/bile acid cotransporter 7